MFWMRNKENNFPIRTLIWRSVVVQVYLKQYFQEKKNKAYSGVYETWKNHNRLFVITVAVTKLA